MTELLTTGQMIDRIKVGEVAECVNAPSEYLEKCVKINKYGNLQYLSGQDFKATLFIMKDARWRIIPEYITFDDAMDALLKGKSVLLEVNSNKYIFHPNEPVQEQIGSNLTWYDLFTGKWRIYRDQN